MNSDSDMELERRWRRVLEEHWAGVISPDQMDPSVVMRGIRGERVWRAAEPEGMGRLRLFHQRAKLVYMAFDPAGQKRLGRIVARGSGSSIIRDASLYQAEFSRCIAERLVRGRVVNALQHAFGYVSERVGGEERVGFVRGLEDYRGGGTVEPLIERLRVWVMRWQVEYLADQYLFDR